MNAGQIECIVCVCVHAYALGIVWDAGLYFAWWMILL